MNKTSDNLPGLMWFQPQASSTLCQQQATAKIYHKFKITKKKVERKNQNDKIKIKEHTTHPEPCTAAPFAFFLAINFSTELKLWLIVEPKEGNNMHYSHKYEIGIPNISSIQKSILR